MYMKLKLNKFVYFLNWFRVCNFIRIYSIRNFIRYATLFKFIQYQNLPKCAAYQKTKKNKKQKKNPNQDITFNHLPRHLSQLGCHQQFLGHLLLVTDQKNRFFHSVLFCWNCTRAHSPCFFVRFLHIRYCTCHDGFCFLLLTLFF